MPYEWIAPASFAFGVGSALATWVERRRNARRAALPGIINSGGNITIINRMDEVLEIVRVEATNDIAMEPGALNDEGVWDPGLVEWMTSPAQIRMNIKPKAEAGLYLQVRQSPRPVIWLVFNSSAGTLKKRRIRVEMFTVLGERPHFWRLRWMLSNWRSTMRRRSERSQ